MSTGNEIVNTIGLDDGLLLGLPVLGDIEGGGVGDSVGERVVSGGNGDCVIGLRLGIFVGDAVIGEEDDDDVLGEIVGDFIV